MPPRLRPTGRLLTPAGWGGLATLVLIGVLAALALGLPRG